MNDDERYQTDMAYIRRSLRREPRWTLLDLWPIVALIIVLAVAVITRGM